MSKTSFLRIEILAETLLVGHRLEMSFASIKTKELWQGFMPLIDKIKDRIGTDLYSIEVYNSPEFVKNFNPNTSFTKWAAVRVNNVNHVPDTMESLIIPEGEYAVFLYQGSSSEGENAYQYIFNTWLPDTDYVLDNRPHFALMGNKYKNNDPDSEEELWIPIKKK